MSRYFYRIYYFIQQLIEKYNEKNFDLSCVNKAKMSKHSKMSIKEEGAGFLIENPSFGMSFKMTPQPERQLTKHLDELSEAVEIHNKKIIHKNIHAQINYAQIKAEQIVIAAKQKRSNFIFVK